MGEKKKKIDLKTHTRGGQLRPATMKERVEHFEIMLQNAKEERVKLLAQKQAVDNRLKEINTFIQNTNNALISLKLYIIGVSPEAAFKMRKRGENPADLLRKDKK